MLASLTHGVRITARAGPRPLLVAGGAILLPLIVVAALAPWIAPYSPYAVDPAHILQAPSAAHWAGTDELGRDLLSRIIYGARTSLSLAFGIVLIASVFGTVVGGVAGFVGGTTDTVIMRLVDFVMALPGLVIALALAAALGPSLLNLAIVLGVLGIPFYIRIARGQTLALRHRPFVVAARTMGAPPAFIIRRHIIPNLLSSIVVLASLDLSGALLAGSSLSFIGLGAQPPTAEWGALVNSGRTYILDQWWYSLLPGAAILITSVGFNLLGDGLRDMLDPKDA